MFSRLCPRGKYLRFFVPIHVSISIIVLYEYRISCLGSPALPPALSVWCSVFGIISVEASHRSAAGRLQSTLPSGEKRHTVIATYQAAHMGYIQQKQLGPNTPSPSPEWSQRPENTKQSKYPMGHNLPTISCMLLLCFSNG